MDTSSLFFMVFFGLLKESNASPQLLYANINEINKIEIDTWTNTTLISGLSRAISLDYHYSLGLVYWTDVLDSKIKMRQIDSVLNRNKDIIQTRINRPDGIAVDWVYNHIYWTDDIYDHIQVSDLEGKMTRTLIDYGIENPRALALDPEKGVMYFSDWGSLPRIERCGLDGKDRWIIVITDIGWPNGLVIDHKERRLYWTDGIRYQIKSSKMDGSDVRNVIKDKTVLPHPFGIAIYGEKVYWTNWEYKSLLRANKRDGTAIEVVKSDLNSPMDVKLYDKNQQKLPSAPRPCYLLNGGCSHLCLPSASFSKNKDGFSCLCPDGYEMKNDNRTCIKGEAEVQLFIAEHHRIANLNLETLQPDKKDVEGLLVNTVAMDVLVKKNLIFWTDVVLKGIYVASIDKGMQIPLIQADIKTPDGLAVDWIYDHIYWTDTGTDEISIAHLDGTMRQTIVNSRLDEPRALALYPQKGMMFFTDSGSSPKIERCSMDGSHRHVIVTKDIKWPNGIIIDYVAERIYWTDGYLQQIKSARFDGGDVYKVVQLNQKAFPQPFGLDLYEDSIYWSNFQHKSIFRAHKYKGTDMLPVIRGLSTPRNIKIVSKTTQPNGVNLCGKNNDGCEHHCLPVPITQNAKGYVCSCADSFILQEQFRCKLRDQIKIHEEL